jgi:hypothetical protein
MKLKDVLQGLWMTAGTGIGLGLSWVVDDVSGWVPLAGMACMMALWTARLAVIEIWRT